MFLERIVNYFNPKRDFSAWIRWLEFNKKYVRDKRNDFVLDAGCGGGVGSALRQYTFCRRVGCDIDKRFANKKYLDYWVACSVEAMCFKAETFQSVSCNWVLEHIKNPARTMEEIFKVLVRGGYFILRTPNLYNYAILFASITSTRFHHWIRRKNATPGQEHVENAPTLYRINTLRRVEKFLTTSGFKIVDIHYEGGASEYLTFFTPFFILGKLGDLITNLFFLRWLKKDIVCVAQKIG